MPIKKLHKRFLSEKNPQYQRYCSEKSKDPAPRGSGNLGMVNFAAETILKGTIGPFSSRDDTTTDVSMLRSYKLFNAKNLYGLCGADCLWLPNSIFSHCSLHCKDLLGN